MITYPTTIAELERAGYGPIVYDTLGAEIQAALLSRGWVKIKEAQPPLPPRPFASQYVGVTRNHGKWCACLGRSFGPRRATEIEAAHDRAKALGQTELERR